MAAVLPAAGKLRITSSSNIWSAWQRNHAWAWQQCHLLLLVSSTLHHPPLSLVRLARISQDQATVLPAAAGDLYFATSSNIWPDWRGNLAWT